jgi:hypothetical protein
MINFYDILTTFIYCLAFILLVLANPYVSRMEDTNEYENIKNFYDTYLKGELFDQLIRISIIYWILRDMKTTLIITTILIIIQKLTSKKNLTVCYKEQKKNNNTV